MSGLKQLTPQEVLFVGGETSTIYQHAAGLIVLDGRDTPGFGFESVRAHLVDRLGRIPHFRWRLHEVPLGLDLPYWAEDDRFDVDHHIHRIAVPSPGDREALSELVGYLYSRHLDRHRPLWEVWIIEGLADGRTGLFTKLHHCMMDGEAANQLVQAISDLEPDADEPLPIDPAFTEAEPGVPPQRWQESITAAWHLSTLPVRTTREVFDVVGRSVRQWFAAPDGARRPRAPMVSFNCDVGAERGLVHGEVSLTGVKAVKEHFDVTVNDVVLALVSGSLRRYLIERDELPELPLRTSMAISLRTAADDAMTNKVTVAGVTLATHLDDPVERLRAIAADADRVKRTARLGHKGVLEMVAVFPPAVVGAMLAATHADVTIQATGVNLIVSNLRGSPFPLYIGGAKVDAIYPMSIIMNGGGINVTCMSYVDEIGVGITIEPSVVDDPWTIVDRLGDELDVLLARLPARSRRGRTRSATS
jgi:diacylglycerol O-acyltransferase